ANYVGGDYPRQAVTKKVYTSTEYPAHLEIVLHNEMSYLNWWPKKIYFFCLNPPQSGGETHIGDSRLILQRLCPGVRKRFEHKQVMYVQTLPNEGRMTKSWQQTFETFERAEVEAHCRQNDMSYRWIAQGLRTQIVRPAVLQHPNTGDWVWFNQADQWHALSQSVKHQDLNVEQLDEEELPCHAYFGDGSPIEVSDLDGIRAAYRDAEVAFRWRAGDVLMLDNMLMAHGRKPFTGNRQVLVAMA
ncbi:MAG: TauD/TfdA family dioxygenase, partial [Gammaproteobacteria bacterium]|nr:TauD/TfdA family dioxygenase [Gammaproteobacteria bacterium]